MLWTKRARQSTIFQTFEGSNKSSPNSSCRFWNYKVRAYSNFASLFSVMSVQCLVYFGLKKPIINKFSIISVVGWKLNKFLQSYLKPKLSFSLNFSSIGKWWRLCQKPQNGKSKFLNLLILEHLKNYFIKNLNKFFDVLWN